MNEFGEKHLKAEEVFIVAKWRKIKEIERMLSSKINSQESQSHRLGTWWRAFLWASLAAFYVLTNCKDRILDDLLIQNIYGIPFWWHMDFIFYFLFLFFKLNKTLLILIYLYLCWSTGMYIYIYMGIFSFEIVKQLQFWILELI